MCFIQKVEAMSRGVVVLDNNIESLESHLQKRNIKVIIPPAGMHSIIDVPMDLMTDPGKAAKAISDIIISHALWSKSHAFLVTINANGKSSFKELTN